MGEDTERDGELVENNVSKGPPLRPVLQDHAIKQIIEVANQSPFVSGGAVSRIANDLLKLKVVVRRYLDGIFTEEELRNVLWEPPSQPLKNGLKND